LRPPIVGSPMSKRSAQTIALASAAAALIYYAYAQLSGCLCVWSGNGVALAGLGFWVVYLLVLTLPAANTVLQEGVLQEPRMHPVLMLALQNLLACLLFLPVLLLAHMAAFEDIRAAVMVTFAHREVYMIVTWLCLQMTLISAISVGVLCLTNAFWATTLRSLRVVYWWLCQLVRFYFGSMVHPVLTNSLAVNITSPHASMWSLVMLCGLGLAAVTIYMDRRENATMRKYSLPPMAAIPPMAAAPKPSSNGSLPPKCLPPSLPPMAAVPKMPSGP